MRAEKGFIIVGQDTDGTVTPNDAGLDWAIGKNKTDFVGIRGLARPDLVAAGRKQLVGLRTKDPAIVLEEGAQIVEHPDQPLPMKMIGHVTSSYWSENCGRSIALALVASAAATASARRCSCRCRPGRSKSRSAARCFSTGKETASMAEAARAASAAVARRRPKLAGSELRLSSVAVAVLPPASRVSLRAPSASVPALSKALRVELPARPKSAASAGGRSALWLGPDEWLVIAAAEDDLLADLAGVEALHSAVDVSHRNVAFAVSGADAEATLGAGCPQDLAIEAFPVGACSRSVLGKVEIVLYRTAGEAFRVECWRSFADYVLAFLGEAARDAAIDSSR